ncbi:MAG TPA: tetratricopeptide repeat protein [Terriglobia bacterium]|nr:tetratricopeptide repeat protein [Terriglobia bacterium]
MLNPQDPGARPGPNESANWRATARFTEGYKRLRTFRRSSDWQLLDEAEKLLQEAIVMDPAYQSARFHLGVVEELKGRHEDAAHQFEEVLTLADRAETEVLYNAGLAYFHQYSNKGYERAETYLREASAVAERGPRGSQDSQRDRAVGVLARAVLAQVYSHQAIRPVNEPAARFKPLAETYYQKALETAGEALKEFESSEAAIEKVDPTLKNDIGWGIHNARGHAKLYAGQRSEDATEKEKLFSEALAEFKRALEYDPDNVRVLSNIGSARLFQAQTSGGPSKPSLLDEAEREFQRVLTLVPDYDFAYCRLAQIEIERGDSKAAEKYLELAKKHPSEMTPEYLQALKERIDSMPIRLLKPFEFRPPQTR